MHAMLGTLIERSGVFAPPVAREAAENRTSWYDFHATVLHLLGIDHERLTYYHNGIRRRLTNVHGNVVHELLA